MKQHWQSRELPRLWKRAEVEAIARALNKGQSLAKGLCFGKKLRAVEETFWPAEKICHMFGGTGSKPVMNSSIAPMF